MSCSVFNSESRKVYVAGYVNFAAFPSVGAENTIYIDDTTNEIYRWNGSAYVLIGQYPSVPTYADLPAAAPANNGQIYIVTTPTGSPGSPGYKSAGFYVSNGTTWNFIGNGGAIESIQGTANQVLVNGTSGSPQAGNIILTTPQNIGTGSSPTFAGLTLTGLSGVLKAATGVISGSSTTSDLPEGSNLYFTEPRVLATLLTGYSIGANTALAATDSILSAFGKVQGQISARPNVSYSGESYLSLNSTTQVLTGNPIDLSGSNVTNFLKAASFPAQTGDVTNSAGSLSNTISAGAVSLSKMANLAANSFIGNNTGSPATPLALTIAQAKTMLSLSGTNSGDVTVSGENFVTIAGQALTISPVNVSGTNITGTLKAASFPALTGDITTSAGSLSTTLAANAVTNAKFRQSAALSVVGNATNASANVADISGTADQILRVNSAGNALAFGAINLASANAVTGTLPNANTTATSANTVSTIVARDGSGNFVAGTITAALSGNSTTATTLQTARNIYGNSFNGSADLTQIIASNFGGTGNGFTKFSGPATSEKTFTLPNATCSILTTNAAVTEAQGGTNATSYNANALIFQNSGNTAFTSSANLTYSTNLTLTSGNLIVATNGNTLNFAFNDSDKILLLGKANSAKIIHGSSWSFGFYAGSFTSDGGSGSTGQYSWNTVNSAGTGFQQVMSLSNSGTLTLPLGDLVVTNLTTNGIVYDNGSKLTNNANWVYNGTNQTTLTGSTAGTAFIHQINQTDTGNTGSHAYFHAQTGGNNAGCPFFRFTIPSLNDYVCGIDNSNNRDLFIGKGTVPVSTAFGITITYAGDVRINQDGGLASTRTFSVANSGQGSIANITASNTQTGSANSAIINASRGDTANGSAILRLSTGATTEWDIKTGSGGSALLIYDVVNAPSVPRMSIASSGDVNVFSGDLIMNSLTKTIVLSKTTASAGAANGTTVIAGAMVAGTITVTNSLITNVNDWAIYPFRIVPGGTSAALYATHGVGTVTIRSGTLDTSTVGYVMLRLQ